MSCTQCGAPREPGSVVCKFCNAAYDEDRRGAPGAQAAQAGASAAHTADIGATHCRSWHGSTSRTTSVSLSGEYLTFASGSPSQIAISDIVEVHDEGAMRGGNGNKALLLHLKSDGNVGMLMTPADHQVWLDELVRRGLKLTHA